MEKAGTELAHNGAGVPLSIPIRLDWISGRQAQTFLSLGSRAADSDCACRCEGSGQADASGEYIENEDAFVNSLYIAAIPIDLGLIQDDCHKTISEKFISHATSPLRAEISSRDERK